MKMFVCKRSNIHKKSQFSGLKGSVLQLFALWKFYEKRYKDILNIKM